MRDWNWVDEDERLDDILEYNKPEYHWSEYGKPWPVRELEEEEDENVSDIDESE